MPHTLINAQWNQYQQVSETFNKISIQAYYQIVHFFTFLYPFWEIQFHTTFLATNVMIF